MLNKVRQYIDKHDLLFPRDRCIVALSGGADSVALLHILLALHYHVEAAHCNFHLRGEESDRDEQFVTDLCQHLDVTLHKTDFDTRSYAKEHKVSIEMAARTLRYEWFDTLCDEDDRKQTVICVAHHKDDSV